MVGLAPVVNSAVYSVTLIVTSVSVIVVVLSTSIDGAPQVTLATHVHELVYLFKGPVIAS